VHELAVTNHSAYIPRECCPEASKWEMILGSSGTLMSNRSKPAGVNPVPCVYIGDRGEQRKPCDQRAPIHH
jgi:hypothetical protein